MVDAVKEALKDKKSIEGTTTEEEVLEKSKRSKAQIAIIIPMYVVIGLKRFADKQQLRCCLHHIA